MHQELISVRAVLAPDPEEAPTARCRPDGHKVRKLLAVGEAQLPSPLV